MRAGGWFGVIVGCGLLWATPGSALPAEPVPAAASRSTPPRVTTVMVGGPSMPSFAQRLQSWFQGETQVSVTREPALIAAQILAGQSTDAVQVWIDLTALDLARVYFVTSERGARRWLVRDVPLEHGVDELGQERLAQVVFSSVQAVWEGSAASTRSEVEGKLATLRYPAS